jgi:thiamine transport system substrate-binding protein
MAYESPLLAEIPDAFELDETYRLLPVDVGDVCLNYDKTYFADNSLPVPESLAALTDPIYADQLVVQNPATSSPGLAFLLATIANFGTEGDYTYLDYWADLRANGVLVTNDWTDAYYGQFSVASDGNRPLVVSYSTSPPAEVIFADPPVETAPSVAITAPGTCFRQVEFVGILNGTDRPELAQKLVDFMLSKPFQEDMPLRMFVYPVNQNAGVPAEFSVWSTTPTDPANLPPAEIDANRESWIEAWREVVLQ